MTKKYFAFLVLTVVGGLLFALGMCVSCCLVWTDSVFALGVIVGVIGMAVLSLAYPMYNRAIKRERERVAPEVLRLTEDLMK